MWSTRIPTCINRLDSHWPWCTGTGIKRNVQIVNFVFKKLTYGPLYKEANTTHSFTVSTVVQVPNVAAGWFLVMACPFKWIIVNFAGVFRFYVFIQNLEYLTYCRVLECPWSLRMCPGWSTIKNRWVISGPFLDANTPWLLDYLLVPLLEDDMHCYNSGTKVTYATTSVAIISLPLY